MLKCEEKVRNQEVWIKEIPILYEMIRECLLEGDIWENNLIEIWCNHLDIQGVSKQREQKCDSPEIFLRCVKGGPVRSLGNR